ncbi:MAG: hypothetical protein WDN10_01435 [bacterium]
MAAHKTAIPVAIGTLRIKDIVCFRRFYAVLNTDCSSEFYFKARRRSMRDNLRQRLFHKLQEIRNILQSTAFCRLAAFA